MSNPEKAHQLRFVKIVLAIALMVSLIIGLDRLPTTRPASPAEPPSSQTDAYGARRPYNLAETPADFATFCVLSGAIIRLEQKLDRRLHELGVPESDYEHADSYLSKDELAQFESQATLAAKLESVMLRAYPAELLQLQELFDFDTATINRACGYSEPDQYQDLSELLAAYQHDWATIDDYESN